MISFNGVVQDAGGGIVTILVDRDTQRYPEIGVPVLCIENGRYVDDVPQPGQPTMSLLHPESRRVIDGLRWLFRRRR